MIPCLIAHGCAETPGSRIKHDQPERGDAGDQEDQAPRQPRERPRDDGGGDHAKAEGSGGRPLADRHAAVLRAKALLERSADALLECL